MKVYKAYQMERHTWKDTRRGLWCSGNMTEGMEENSEPIVCPWPFGLWGKTANASSPVV